MNSYSKQILNKIGYTVRFYRRARSLSQVQMGEMIGMSYRNIQRIEAGEVEPRLETLQNISRVLDLPISSLVRDTNCDILFIKEVSSRSECDEFSKTNLEVVAREEDLKFAQSAILKDQQVPFRIDSSKMAVIDYNKATFSESLAECFGLPLENNNLDQYSVDGTSAERWEFIFRSNIKQACIKNFYVFPSGFKAIESYHPNISQTPDSPTSECFVRDVTSRHELELWLQQNISSRR